MWYGIFFDQNNNFQWASIAAIVSFLAFVSTIISIIVTSRQGEKNRKSATLVSLRIEELKEIRKEIASIMSLTRIYVGKKQDDLEFVEWRSHAEAAYALLYRDELHVKVLYMALNDFEAAIYNVENKSQMVEMVENLEGVLKTYSVVEYKKIEEYL